MSETPIRRVLTRGGKRAIDVFCSYKMKRMIPTESSNELALVMRAELDPTVDRIYAQPLRVDWHDGTRSHHHVPDFAIVRGNRVEIREAKPDDEANTDEVVAVTRQARKWCALRGVAYDVDVESVLKAQPVHSRIGDVLYYLHDDVPDAMSRRLVEFVQDVDHPTIDKLVSDLGRHGCTKGRLLALVARRLVYVDFSQPIDGNTVLMGSPPPSSSGLLPRLPDPIRPASTAI